MERQRVQCPACNREVELVATESTMQDSQATIPDGVVACLDVSASCGPGCCPVLAVTPEVLRSRLARHGMGDHLPRLHASCSTCERVTEMIMVGASYCWCTECGATSPTRLWEEMELPTESSDL